jgi:lysophospholipase L1-like esterase
MISLLVSIVAIAAPPEPFALKEGDRVVWLGGTFIEREQSYSRFEEFLQLVNRKPNLVFRNLAWSGDTVWGEARAAFDPPAKGYERLIALTKEAKPTVIVLAYGSNESFAGEAGLDAFRKQYERLMNDLASTNARFILLTPIPFENGPGMGDVATKNKRLESYNAVIRDLAKAKGAALVDLYERMSQTEQQARPFTENGLHPGDEGYRRIAKLLWTPPILSKHDDELRARIRAKDELFFHRWRPQNETYLFGFRKHEQGKNAKDIVAFDPLIAEAEKAIAERLKAIPVTPNHP